MMKASDVMVREVVTIGTEATVQEAAALLLKHRISGVPVVDASGKVVGVVTEGDLLHRAEAGTEQRPSWLSLIFTSNQSLAADYVKSHSRKVTDVMTRKVITVPPSTPLHEIATLFEKHGIKRVPVVDAGRLVGIVSRSNLIQAVAAAPDAPPTADDAALRERIMNKIGTSGGWARPYLVNALVHGGTVELWGVVETEAERSALRVAAEVTPGVRAVKDNITVRTINTWV